MLSIKYGYLSLYFIMMYGNIYLFHYSTNLIAGRFISKLDRKSGQNNDLSL